MYDICVAYVYVFVNTYEYFMSSVKWIIKSPQKQLLLRSFRRQLKCNLVNNEIMQFYDLIIYVCMYITLHTYPYPQMRMDFFYYQRIKRLPMVFRNSQREREIKSAVNARYVCMYVCCNICICSTCTH